MSEASVQWEYQILEGWYEHVSDEYGAGDVFHSVEPDALNQAGADGWEAVSAQWQDGTFGTQIAAVLMKRVVRERR